MTAELRRPVVLIGPMGAGKTSVGRRVAKAIQVPFIDTDKRIVERHGVIADLFEKHGEPHFRAIEKDVVAEALAEHDAVVSLGGGAVLDPATRILLQTVPVVLLTVSPEAVAARLRGSDRPLLHHDGLRAWTAIADARAPLYAELAGLTLDTSHRPLSHVVDDIVTWVGTERT